MWYADAALATFAALINLPIREAPVMRVPATALCLDASRQAAIIPSNNGRGTMAAQQDATEADFIVIGAGSAGCTIAARLSEDPSTRVLLLEAGGDDTNRWIHIPLGFGKTFADPSVNWCYETEPDAGANGRKVFWPRGKVHRRLSARSTAWSTSVARPRISTTGASSAIPAGRSTTCCPISDAPSTRCAAAMNSTAAADRSPCRMSSATPSPKPLSTAQWRSASRVTTTSTARPRTASVITRRRPARAASCSTAVGYLNPARQRANLTIVTNALSEKIVVEGRRAVAVQYRQAGQLKTAHARREIILCGGAINSPQLLMLSGIGPAAHLAEHGIAVVQDLRGVGQNLQDHYSAAIKLKATAPITVNDVMLSNVRKLKVGAQYYMFRTGPLAMISSPAALFAKTRPELATSDVKCSISPFSADRPQDGLHKFSGFTMIAYQLRPESRGEIRLKSANPADPPAMIPNYLSDPVDQQTIVDGLKLCRRILAHPSIRPLHRRGVPARPARAD